VTTSTGHVHSGHVHWPGPLVTFTGHVHWSRSLVTRSLVTFTVVTSTGQVHWSRPLVTSTGQVHWSRSLVTFTGHWSRPLSGQVHWSRSLVTSTGHVHWSRSLVTFTVVTSTGQVHWSRPLVTSTGPGLPRHQKSRGARAEARGALLFVGLVGDLGGGGKGAPQMVSFSEKRAPFGAIWCVLGLSTTAVLKHSTSACETGFFSDLSRGFLCPGKGMHRQKWFLGHPRGGAQGFARGAPGPPGSP
jgi:hypothetical protein